MAISAIWRKDSADGVSFEGYVVRNGIDTPATGYRFDNLGLVYLDKNENKKLDVDDLTIGSIIDTQVGVSGTLRQDPSQQTLYSIRDTDNPFKSAGIAVIFDADFNSGKAVAPPPPKITAPISSGTTPPSTPATSSSAPFGASSAATATPVATAAAPSVPSAASGGSSTATSPSPVGTASSPSNTSVGSTPTKPAIGTLANSATSAFGSTPGTSVSPVATVSGLMNPSLGSTSDTPLPANLNPLASTVSGDLSTLLPQTWDKLSPTATGSIAEIVSYFIPKTTSAATQQFTPTGKQLELGGYGLAYTADVTNVIKAKSTGGDVLTSPDLFLASGITMLLGGKGNDIIRGGLGTELIDGGAGNDIIKSGDGDDVITGGRGADQLWGGFGKNIFLYEKDGFVDKVFITSDQFLSNPNLNGKVADNADGHNADIIKSLDAIDRLIFLGVNRQDLSFSQLDPLSFASGIGIYARGCLEAVYTGQDLSIQQLSSMTTGIVSGYADILNSI